jgi:hypothetical protein
LFHTRNTGGAGIIIPVKLAPQPMTEYEIIALKVERQEMKVGLCYDNYYGVQINLFLLVVRGGFSVVRRANN